jgi:capsule polysaccharide export protein KpsE/RkpR
VSKASDLIEEYLSVGGLFNPEIMNQMQHDAVRDTLIIARDEIRGLEKRIKQLEETLEAVTDKLDDAWGIYMQFKEPKP